MISISVRDRRPLFTVVPVFHYYIVSASILNYFKSRHKKAKQNKDV